MNNEQIEVINKFLDHEFNDEGMTELQEAVGMMSTCLAHTENKLEVIIGIMATGLDQYEALDETVGNMPLIGFFSPE